MLHQRARLHARDAAPAFPANLTTPKHASHAAGRTQYAHTLSLALESGPDKQRGAAAQELSLVAPPVAIDKITEVLAGGSRSLRRELRSALATAAKSERASDALRAKLSADGVPAPVLLDLLRASADRPEVKKEAGVAFARLATPAADFRRATFSRARRRTFPSRATLRAQAYLESAVRSDQDPHVRARAAEALGDVPSPSSAGALLASLADAEPRVRDASLSSLRHAPWTPAMTPRVAERLADDPWTFVRVHAAESLGGAPAGKDADDPLARALSDRSPLVRGQAVDTLGARGAVAHAGDVRSRLEDEDENADVRTRAARALGALCESEVDRSLTEVARPARAQAPMAKQAMSAGAAAALGRLYPAHSEAVLLLFWQRTLRARCVTQHRPLSRKRSAAALEARATKR